MRGIDGKTLLYAAAGLAGIGLFLQGLYWMVRC